MSVKASRILTVVAILIVLAVGIFIADFVFNVPILRSIPVTRKIGCSYSVVIKGDSMSPTLKKGDRVTFNRCISDLAAIDPGTIVVFEERGTRVGRIKSSGKDENGFFYEINQDNRGSEIHIVRPDRIRAILE